MRTTITANLFFDGRFWKILVERIMDGSLSIATHVFGGEPTDIEVYEWGRKGWNDLVFSPAISVAHSASPTQTTYTRATKAARKSLNRTVITPAIRAAAQTQRKERKGKVKKETREKEILLAEHKREIRSEKAKSKRRGH